MGGSLLTQWIAKYGSVPIALIGMAGLALEIGVGEWKTGDIFVAEAPVVIEAFVERWPYTLEIEVEPKLMAAPVVAESFVERRPPPLETKTEPNPSMPLAALNPEGRLRDEADQPASKG